MTHEEIREIVNAELKKKSLLSLSPEEGDRVSFGLSSGSILLNLALSGNPKVGYLWGRIVEIYGTESSGKSTLALHVVKEAQEYEKTTGEFIPILYCDAENALDPIYAQNIGIDVSKLSVTQPTCFEEALNEIELCIKNGYRLVIVDSVAALVPRAELEGEVGESHMGLQARLMSQSLRKLTGLISKKEAIVIFINQIRMKIGVFFGNLEVTTGGQALKFYASYRLDVRAPRSGVVKAKTLLGLGAEETVEVGTKVVVHVVKNKVYPPHRKAEFKIVYGKGIDVVSDLVGYMELAGLFQQVGKKQVFTIDSRGYSANQLLKEMTENNEFYYKVKNEVLK